MANLRIATRVFALLLAVTQSAGAQTGVEAGTRTVTTESAKDIGAKALLGNICGGGSSEPACNDLADLSDDEAWVVLNYACRLPLWQSTAPCSTFRQQRGGVLIFNLKTNGWAAQWEQTSYPLSFDVTGVPAMRLRPGDAKPLKILVEEVSPLTYSAAPGVSKEEDLEIVANLKSFLALAGIGLQGLVQTLAFVVAPTAPASSEPRSYPPPGFAPDRELRGRQPGTCAIEPPDVRAAAQQVTRRQEQLVRVGTAMRALENELDRFETTRATFVRVAQKAEDGAAVAASELVGPNQRDLHRAYDDLDDSTRALAESADHLASCQPLLGAYATLIGAPSDGRVIHDLASRIRTIEGCSAPDVSELAASLRANAALLAGSVLADSSMCPSARLKSIIELHRDAMKPMVERLVNAKQVEDKVWSAIDQASRARGAVVAAADALSRQVERGRRHTWNNTLIRALAVTRPNPELRWNKVQSHEIIVKADSPYVKELTLAHAAEEKRAYKLESATGLLLGFGIGIIYTPLYESTFAAVAAPGTSTKVITETERETRAGDLAAFLSYRFLQHRPAKRWAEPTLDFGVGLTSGRPAFFLGLGFEILRAARIGFGWAPERVSQLAEGQIPNVTVVSSTDDIRIVKRFATDNYYVSFTFALDSLSLFNSR
jgi:hypothetical protein